MGGEHKLQAQSSPFLSKYVYKLRVQKSRAKLRKTWPNTVPKGPLRGGTAARGTTSREAVPRGYSFSGYRFAGAPLRESAAWQLLLAGVPLRGRPTPTKKAHFPLRGKKGILKTGVSRVPKRHAT